MLNSPYNGGNEAVRNGFWQGIKLNDAHFHIRSPAEDGHAAAAKLAGRQ